MSQVHHLVPVHLLKSITGYKIPFGQIERTLGMCTEYSDYSYKITLLTYKQKGKNHEPATIEDILLTLAHELTHLIHDRHDIYFARLYMTIMHVFVENLNRYGIVDIQTVHSSLEEK